MATKELLIAGSLFWVQSGKTASKGLCQQGVNLGFLALLKALFQMQRFALLSGCKFWQGKVP